MTSLAERTALVTGANRGMGREYVAQLLGRKVAKVYAATRNPLAIDVSDPRVIPLQLDVTDAVSVAEAADLATDVGILINNAGISRASSVLDKDTSALRGELETNLFGPLALASAFADRIAERSGAIVNVSSVLAWLPLGMSYGVSRRRCGARRSRCVSSWRRAVCRWWASTWGWSTPTWVDSPTRRSPILPMWSARCSTE